ncbi:Monocarboxylate transporter 12 [Holothuria leucospilota]|uniref:Monocarboxylate transporter 12 n=1 Tax=Holothuria leucospilota TaxID=206669 RepID=A0A9Q1CGH9_HOLLE|nr:Monocarboxylate transporter 12 [Holothuria leucospilota]
MNVKWIVLIAACARGFFYTGSIKANGVLLDDIVLQVDSTHSLVAWAFSLQNGLALMMAPLAVVLLEIFTNKELFVAGGLLAGAGYIFCGLTTDSVWQLHVGFAASGIGFGFCAAPAIIAVKQYHKENFGSMMSIAGLWHFVGMGILPVVLQFLRTVYGVNQSLLLYGAINWNLAAFGFGLRQPSRQATLNQMSDSADSTMETSQRDGNEDMQISEKENQKGSVLCRWLSSYLSLRVHKKVILLAISEVFALYMLTSWAGFLVSFGRSVGLTPYEAVFLSSVGGVSGFLSQITTLILFKTKKMHIYIFGLAVYIVNGTSLLVVSLLVKQFYIICCLTFLSGFSIGTNVTALVGILPSTVCKHHFKQAATLIFLVDGIGAQLGGVMSGEYHVMKRNAMIVKDSVQLIEDFPWALKLLDGHRRKSRKGKGYIPHFLEMLPLTFTREACFHFETFAPRAD